MARDVHWAVHAVVPLHHPAFSRYRNASALVRTTAPAHGATERFSSMRRTRVFTRSPFPGSG